jgi:hypothetical protein
MGSHFTLMAVCLPPNMGWMSEDGVTWLTILTIFMKSGRVRGTAGRISRQVFVWMTLIGVMSGVVVNPFSPNSLIQTLPNLL